MHSLLAALLILSFQTAAPKSVPAPLIGKWVSTVKPQPGEAPAIAPSFTIEKKANKFVVSLEGDTEAYQATPFGVSKTESVLVIRTPATSKGLRTMIIRPLPGGQVRFELFQEYPEGSRQSNFYYAEVFKKEG
jgi:hypothetical protein